MSLTNHTSKMNNGHADDEDDMNNVPFEDGLNDEPEEDRTHTQGTKAFAVSSNKPLTSKFRGVCWNKKNKRWQAAINSSGKYLYLGSYDTQEEAARIFDKAAVRIRADKARLNFRFKDYTDANGAVLPDPQVEALLLEACNPTKPRRQRTKTKAAAAAAAAAEEGRSGLGGAQPGTSSLIGSLGALPPTTDPAAADIALQALVRLYGQNNQDLNWSSLLTQRPGGVIGQLGMGGNLGGVGGSSTLLSSLVGQGGNNSSHLLGGAPGSSSSGVLGIPQLHHLLTNGGGTMSLSGGGAGAGVTGLMGSGVPLLSSLTGAGTSAGGFGGGGLSSSSAGGGFAANLLQELVSRGGGGGTPGVPASLSMQAPSLCGVGPQAPLLWKRPSMQGMNHGMSSNKDIFEVIKAELPVGAKLDSLIPSGKSNNDVVVGVLYSLQDKTGAAIWNGKGLQRLGTYGSEADAKQACNGALQFYRKMTEETTVNTTASKISLVSGSTLAGTALGGNPGASGLLYGKLEGLSTRGLLTGLGAPSLLGGGLRLLGELPHDVHTLSGDQQASVAVELSLLGDNIKREAFGDAGLKGRGATLQRRSEPDPVVAEEGTEPDPTVCEDDLEAAALPSGKSGGVIALLKARIAAREMTGESAADTVAASAASSGYVRTSDAGAGSRVTGALVHSSTVTVVGDDLVAEPDEGMEEERSLGRGLVEGVGGGGIVEEADPDMPDEDQVEEEQRLGDVLRRGAAAVRGISNGPSSGGLFDIPAADLAVAAAAAAASLAAGGSNSGPAAPLHTNGLGFGSGLDGPLAKRQKGLDGRGTLAAPLSAPVATGPPSLSRPAGVSSLQQLSNIDVREALSMFIAGRQG
ncbi:hypothetical protein CEUSTIGMA_g8566.t1 [Chlamydomonas eustigma]|uniref:AP2/ERF domain-containing protein n=1 Tax=Chlamydomonas eustigma TaxID=1157962 RepID=A0A250XE09_9CHLO|nr:hypothetical protein CEUSTIGMA_g8566.t1 [Chlamydomonas eustigma]|eukprot:GAX81132.1 hypothetical protein CEUSTIGMA_g8566.t1 [Chlamydomonas eustigma]